jgi:transposase
MKSESKINKDHMSVEDLTKEIHELERDAKMLERLNLVRMVYKTNDIAKSCELLDIPSRTGYGWVEKWNKNGIVGLRHKKGAGRPPFLSKKQLHELDEWMIDKDYLVTNDVYLYIKDEYGVDYSTKQVQRIIKKLDYVWVVPYPIAEDQPENAEELLKEATKDLDLDKDVVGFVDETAVQNTPNVGKVIKKKLQKGN